MIVKKDLIIRIEISANGIKRFYIEDKDLEDWGQHLYQSGHTEFLNSNKKDLAETSYSSATYGSLYKDELIKIAEGEYELIETTKEEKVYLIKIIFNMFINKWGHPDVPYQV